MSRVSASNFLNVTKYNTPYQSKSQNDILNDTITSINESYDDKLGKYDAKIEQQIREDNDLQDLKGEASNLLSSMKSLTSLGSGWRNGMMVNGAPNGLTIKASAAAKAGNHTMKVNQIAQKQSIYIQSIDAMGNARPFPLNAADVTSPSDPTKQKNVTLVDGNGVSVETSSNGTFKRNGKFSIYDKKDNLLSEVTIPNNAMTLQEIANAINQKLNADAANRNETTKVTAFVQSDNTGSTLVLQSTEPGKENDFYVAPQGITGINNDGYLETNPPTANNEAALSALKVFCPREQVKTIDIYNPYGLMFIDPANIIFDTSPFTWAIGTTGYSINFTDEDAKDLYTIATRINSVTAFTGGVSAQVIKSENDVTMLDDLGAKVTQKGYILRIYGAANYTHDNLAGMFGGIAPNDNVVRVSSACDTEIRLDNFDYNLGSDLTLNNPTPEIDSITVSSPTQETNITIAQDTTAIKDAILKMVDSVNSMQEIIAAKRKSYDSRMPSELRSAINAIESIINKLKFSSGAITNSEMGLTWVGSGSNASLKIDETKLQNALTNKFHQVKDLFTGSLVQVGGAANVTLSNLNPSMQISRFDLEMSSLGGAIGARASNYGGGAPIDLTYTTLTATTGLITGKAGTIFSGLSMQYSRATALTANETSNITIRQGVASTLENQIKSYNDSVQRYASKIQTTREKNRKLAIKMTNERNEKIKKAQTLAATLKRQEESYKQLQKLMEKMLGGYNSNGG